MNPGNAWLQCTCETGMLTSVYQNTSYLLRRTFPKCFGKSNRSVMSNLDGDGRARPDDSSDEVVRSLFYSHLKARKDSPRPPRRDTSVLFSSNKKLKEIAKQKLGLKAKSENTPPPPETAIPESKVESVRTMADHPETSAFLPRAAGTEGETRPPGREARERKDGEHPPTPQAPFARPEDRDANVSRSPTHHHVAGVGDRAVLDESASSENEDADWDDYETRRERRRAPGVSIGMIVFLVLFVAGVIAFVLLTD